MRFVIMDLYLESFFVLVIQRTAADELVGADREELQFEDCSKVWRKSDNYAAPLMLIFSCRFRDHFD